MQKNQKNSIPQKKKQVCRNKKNQKEVKFNKNNKIVAKIIATSKIILLQYTIVSNNKK